MNWDRIEGNWKQLTGKVKEQWGKLTDDDIDVIAGNATNSSARSRRTTASPRMRRRSRSNSLAEHSATQTCPTTDKEDAMKTANLMTALLVAAGLTGAGGAWAQTGSKDARDAAVRSAEAQYKSAKATCDALSGNAKDICVEEAKGNERIAKAEAEAAYNNTPRMRERVRVVRADAVYEVAKEKCDDLSGNPKDVCVKEAKATHVKALADAKVDRVAADERRSGAEQTMAASARRPRTSGTPTTRSRSRSATRSPALPRTTASVTRRSVTARRPSCSSPAGGAQTSSMRLTGSPWAGSNIPALFFPAQPRPTGASDDQDCGGIVR